MQASDFQLSNPVSGPGWVRVDWRARGEMGVIVLTEDQDGVQARIYMPSTDTEQHPVDLAPVFDMFMGEEELAALLFRCADYAEVRGCHA